jgi:hypothetical protein
MPPRIVDANAAGGGVQNWYQSLPPITRTLATVCFLSSLGCYVGLLKPFQLALLRDYVFKQYEVRGPVSAATKSWHGIAAEGRPAAICVASSTQQALSTAGQQQREDQQLGRVTVCRSICHVRLCKAAVHFSSDLCC